MSVLIYIAWAFVFLLFAPILLCWILFGIAALRGLTHKHITPAHILELWSRGIL